MTEHGKRQRIGVIDLVAIELPFVLELARRHGDAFEFHFLQSRADTLALLREHRDRVRRTTGVAPTLAWSDDELYEACGPHARHWTRSRAALLREARPLAAHAQAFIAERNLDAVLIFNGAPLLRALAAHAARRLGKRTIFAENGYLPGTMQLDAQGVNAASSHTTAIAAGVHLLTRYDHAALDETLARLRSGAPSPTAQPVRDPVASTAQRVRREFTRLLRPEAWRWLRPPGTQLQLHARLPDKIGAFVLLPLQVRHDSQLSTYSPLYGDDLERCVRDCRDAVQRAAPGMRLVVKLHPKERRHVQRAHAALAAQLPDVTFVQGQPIRELLPYCSAVITINSTVGVEALAFGKSVVALGQNFYTTPLLVHRVATREGLPKALRTALATPPDARTVYAFLGYLHQTLLVRGSYLDLSAGSIAAIAERLQDLLVTPIAEERPRQAA